ncbi:unnamed protein product [Cunninghamella echinulata]
MLGEEHKKLLISLYDENPSSTINQTIGEFSESFEELKVSKSTVHKFIKEDLGFTFKMAQFHTLQRNDEEVIEKRYNWMNEINNSEVNYLRNRVFIDESGFHNNMKRSQAWAE